MYFIFLNLSEKYVEGKQFLYVTSVSCNANICSLVNGLDFGQIFLIWSG